jgi:hypothetical protein
MDPLPRPRQRPERRATRPVRRRRTPLDRTPRANRARALANPHPNDPGQENDVEHGRGQPDQRQSGLCRPVRPSASVRQAGRGWLRRPPGRGPGPPWRGSLRRLALAGSRPPRRWTQCRRSKRHTGGHPWHRANSWHRTNPTTIAQAHQQPGRTAGSDTCGPDQRRDDRAARPALYPPGAPDALEEQVGRGAPR